MAEDDYAAGTAAGGKRGRMSTRDIATQAGIAGGRIGAREVLVFLGVDTQDPESITRWHHERQFTRDSMKSARDRKRWIGKAVWSAVAAAVIGFFVAGVKANFHQNGDIPLAVPGPEKTERSPRP